MAKERQTEASPETLSLAAQLFVAHWRTGTGRSPEVLATECIEAAESFERAAKRKLQPTAIPFAGAKAS